jgi:hypothetical protein
VRRSAAAALLGISLWLGALAWSGFLVIRTVLDPDRSEDVAEALLDDADVREQMVENIAGGVANGLPEGARVPPEVLEAGAARALEVPEVERLVLDALVASHRALLGEEQAPDTLSGTEFGSAARRALVDSHPELGGFLDEEPSLEVALPTERIPDLGPVRRGLSAVVPVLAVASLAGVVVSLLVTTDRRSVLRRAGFWAIGLSALVLAVAYGIPALASQVVPDQSQIVAALIGALAAATRGPAAALAAAGGACLSLSVLAGSATAARPSTGRRSPPVRPPAIPTAPPVRGRMPSQVPTVPPSGRTDRFPAVDRSGRPVTGGASSPPTAPTEATVPTEPEPTRIEDPLEPPGPPPSRPGARWVRGVGWVHEGDGPIPASARWVAGVGYVLDD